MAPTKHDDKPDNDLPTSPLPPGAAPQGVAPTPPPSEQAAEEAKQDVSVETNEIRPDDEPWHGGPEYKPV